MSVQFGGSGPSQIEALRNAEDNAEDVIEDLTESESTLINEVMNVIQSIIWMFASFPEPNSLKR